MKHSPLPFHLETYLVHVHCIPTSIAIVHGAKDGTGVVIGYLLLETGTAEENAANAELIILAVNSHYQMLEAAQAVIASIDRAKSSVPRSIDPGSRLDIEADKLRSAILAATKEQSK